GGSGSSGLGRLAGTASIAGCLEMPAMHCAMTVRRLPPPFCSMVVTVWSAKSYISTEGPSTVISVVTALKIIGQLWEYGVPDGFRSVYGPNSFAMVSRQVPVMCASPVEGGALQEILGSYIARN